MEQKKKKSETLFGVFLYPQLISAVLFVVWGAEAVHFAYTDRLAVT